MTAWVLLGVVAFVGYLVYECMRQASRRRHPSFIDADARAAMARVNARIRAAQVAPPVPAVPARGEMAAAPQSPLDAPLPGGHPTRVVRGGVPAISPPD